MTKYAFISRHKPTEAQHALAAEQGVELEAVGDVDAFTVTPEWVAEKGEFYGVIVVHPAAVLRLQHKFAIGVFENANRAAEGEKPTFEAVALHLFMRQ